MQSFPKTDASLNSDLQAKSKLITATEDYIA